MKKSAITITGYTVSSAAELLGVSESFVKSILRGKNKTVVLRETDFLTVGAKHQYVLLPSGIKKIMLGLETPPSMLQQFLQERKLARQRQAELDAQLEAR